MPKDPEPVEGEETGDGRRSAKPLVWLLLVIALLAILWYAYSGRDPVPAQPAPEVPAVEPADPDDSGAAPAQDDDPSPPPSPSRDAVPAPPADRAAEPLARVQPAYPTAALRAREEGTVLLRVEVDADGLPASVEIERSSRSRELDRAARDAVSQWTFRPAIENGRPAASTVTVPVDFSFEER